MPHQLLQENASRLAFGLGCFSLALGFAEMLAPRGVARLAGLPHNRRTATTLRAFGAREVANGIAILAQPRRSGWLWSRVGGDMLDLSYLSSAAGRADARPRRVAAAISAVLGVTALDVLSAQRLGHPEHVRADERGISASAPSASPAVQAQ